MTKLPTVPRLERVAAFFLRLPSVTFGLAIATAFIAILSLLAHYSRFFFYLPTGARFAALLLLPRQFWIWVIVGEWISRGIAAAGYDVSSLRYIMAIFPQPLAGLAAVWLLRYFQQQTEPDSPAGMASLVGAMLLSASIETLSMVAFMLTDPPATQRVDIASFTPSVFLGDLSGLLLIVPFVLALRFARPLLPRWRSVLAGALLSVYLPLLALYLTQQFAADALIREYARILMAAPVVYFAFRHGWRGAALATTIVGAALAPLQIPLFTAPDLSVAPQFLFVIIAIAALLLGSALDTQRASGRALATQNVNLEHANRDLDRLGVELREAAQRNLRMEEEQRRRLAAEIHDELGQNLTAVHTRIKLASDRLDAAQLGDVTTSIVDILGTMRRSVHGLMESLRPPALDEFGLIRALAGGPLRDMAERAGLVYEFSFRGEPALVDALCEDTQIAIWRIVQEATTNAVRHAQAQRFTLFMRIGIRGDAVWVVLDLRDDGLGIDATRDPARRGDGLQGIHDRVLALDGALHAPSSGSGTRLHVLLRQIL